MRGVYTTSFENLENGDIDRDRGPASITIKPGDPYIQSYIYSLDVYLETSGLFEIDPEPKFRTHPTRMGKLKFEFKGGRGKFANKGGERSYALPTAPAGSSTMVTKLADETLKQSVDKMTDRIGRKEARVTMYESSNLDEVDTNQIIQKTAYEGMVAIPEQVQKSTIKQSSAQYLEDKKVVELSHTLHTEKEED